MSVALWADLVARSRGLRTHLLTPAALHGLAACPDLPTLRDGLARNGFAVGEETGPAALEAAVRHRAALDVERLGRWLRHRARMVAALLGEEDRRSVRAAVRGLVAGAPPAARLSGLIPTPFLPEASLAALAAAESLPAAADVLRALDHPLAAALAHASPGGEVDLFTLELALDVAWARWATAGARRGGRRLRIFVAELIDDRNRVAAGLLARTGAEVDPERAFLPGGRAFDARAFQALAREPAATPADETELRRQRRHALAIEARLAPLGPAVVLGWLLDLRTQVETLQRLIWGLSLGAPQAARSARIPEGV